MVSGPPVWAVVLAMALMSPFAGASPSDPEVAAPTPISLYLHEPDAEGNFVFSALVDRRDTFSSTAYSPVVQGPNGFGDGLSEGRNAFLGMYWPGLESSVRLDTADASSLHLYFRLESAAGPTVPVLAPNYAFTATLVSGDALYDYDSMTPHGFQDSTLILSGETVVHLFDDKGQDMGAVVDALSADRPVLTPNDDGFIHLTLPLEMAVDEISHQDDLGLRIEWYQVEPEEGSDVPRAGLADGTVHAISDWEHLPRLVMPVANPLTAQYLHPVPIEQGTLIHFGIENPLSKLDVDPWSARLTIDGPANMDDQWIRLVQPTGHPVHGLYNPLFEATFLWEHDDEEPLPDGTYTITATASNLAHTANVTISGQLIVEDGGHLGIDSEGEPVEPFINSNEEVETPFMGIAPALLLLGAVAIFRRRP